MAVSVFPVASVAGDTTFLYRINNPSYSPSETSSAVTITRNFNAGNYVVQFTRVATALSITATFRNSSGISVGSGSFTGSTATSIAVSAAATSVTFGLSGDVGNAEIFVAITSTNTVLPTSEGQLQVLSLFESSQTVSVTANATPFLIIGGGGGGASPVFESWTGSWGGGSGFITVGTVNAGSHSLVIGAGGVGSSGLNANTAANGGTTSFAGANAAGGNRGVGTSGGSGGSGGGGGGGTGGFNGSSGQNGGSGSGYQIPAPWNSFSPLASVVTPVLPSTGGKNPGLGGGFYAGGSGQHGSNNYELPAISPVNGGNGTRGGGGGAGGGGANNTGRPVGNGGTGGNGMLAILRTVGF